MARRIDPRRFLIIPAVMLTAMLLSCGTGGLTDKPATATPTGGEVSGGGTAVIAATVAAIGISTDTVSVKSDDSTKAVITATVLDGGNAVIRNVPVAFSATGGTLSAPLVTTDASGKAYVDFRSGSLDQKNQVVTITATAGGKSAQIPIQIVGSTLTMSSTPAANIPSDGSTVATLTVTAKNAGGVPVYNVPVTLTTSGTGKVDLSAASGKTDSNGRLAVMVTGTQAGEVTVRAEGLGTVATYSYTVTGPAIQVFAITSPTVKPASCSTAATLTIEVTVPDATATPDVTFATTLGSWDGLANPVLKKAVNPATKKVSASLQSSLAGLATVQVYDSARPSITDSLGVVFYAPASQAAQIFLQAEATVLGLSTGGLSRSTTVIAYVKTSQATGSQPVGNAPVAFSIVNPTGGGESISPVVVYTNSSGMAATTFTSGSVSSGAGGVGIKAEVLGSGPPAVSATPISIIIGGTAGSLAIGLGSKITVVSPTTYHLPMSVLVADASGARVEGAEVSLKLWPIQYSTGVWYRVCEPGEGGKCTYVHKPFITGTFDNEDTNENLINDPGEDVNGDGTLTPPNSAAGNVPTKVTTDASGVANFNLSYLKGSAVWLRNRLRATTRVQGTETTTSILFTLPAEKEEAEKGELPNSAFPLFLLGAAGGSVTYTVPAIESPVTTREYSTNSIYSTIDAATRVYTFNVPVGAPSGSSYYDSITVTDRLVTTVTVPVRIVVR